MVDYPTFNEIKSGSKYTTDNYAYMTLEYQEAAKTAVDKYLGTNSEPMTDYEREIINAALQIELPYGIETIKEGLFTATEASEALPSNTTKTLTAYGLLEIGKETFKGCTNLSGVYLKDRTTKIDDYAFDGCKSLTGVAVPATTTTMGKRPFTGCENLTTVDFQGSPYFTCDNSIIYSLENGKKKDIIEFLEGRASGVVAPTEVEGVTGIAEEAFAGTKVSSVDLRTSFVTDIPEGAFMDTPKLFAVYLPDTCKSISKDSFTNSSIAYMEVPESVGYLDNDAFGGTTDKSALQFYCVDGSNAYIYATKNGIMTTSKPLELFYTVTFWDWDSTLLDTQTVAAGGDAVPPEVKGREGYTLTGWVPDYHGVQADLQVTAQYEADDPDASKYTVTFLDWDDSVLKTMLVAPGKDAEPPIDPKREGYTFIGWDKEIPTTMPAENMTVTAQWKINRYTITFDTAGGSEVAPITQDYETAITAPEAPTREGYTFMGWDREIPTTMPAENITLKAKWKDIEKPTGEIVIGTNKWQKFLNKLTFGLFFKDTQEVTINAADNSGTVFISYLVTDRDLSEEELKSLVFSGYEEPFRINRSGEYIVYAMLVDASLNITYLRSDRVTVDNVQPVIGGIENGKTYCEAQTVTIDEKYVDTVTVNGTEVTLDENGSFILPAADGEQKIVATDKAGNTAEMTATVNDGHTGGTATCTEKAVCEVCGKAYGDLDGNHHANLKHIPAKAATRTAGGNIEYWYCEDCDKYFADAAATKEIKQADTVTAKLSGAAKSPQTGGDSGVVTVLLLSGGAFICLVSRRKKRTHTV